MAQNQQLKTQVAAGLSWKFAERLLSQLITFVVSLVLARLLLPEDYGAVAMLTIFITVADVIITSGLAVALIQKKDATEADFSTAFYCNFILSCVLYAILFFLAPTIAKMYSLPELSLLLRVLALKLPVSAYNSIQNSYISRNMQFKKLFFSTLFGTVFSAALGVFFAYKGYGAWALIIQQLSSIAINTLILAFTVKWHPKLIFSRSSFKSMAGYGIKVMGTDLTGTAFNQINPFIVGLKYTTADLGFYTKGQQLPNMMNSTIVNALSSVLFPAISKVANSGGDVKKVSSKSLKLIAYVLFPIMFGLAAVSKELTVVLYTSVWLDMVPYMIIMCVDGAINVIGSIDILILKAIGKSGATLKLELIKKPLYLGLIVLAMYLGIIYIAISVPIMSLIGIMINSIALKKTIKYGFFEKLKDCAYAFLLSAVMFGAVFGLGYIPISSSVLLLAIKVIVGVAIYVGLSALFKNQSFCIVLNYLKHFVKRKRASKSTEKSENAETIADKIATEQIKDSKENSDEENLSETDEYDEKE